MMIAKPSLAALTALMLTACAGGGTVDAAGASSTLTRSESAAAETQTGQLAAANPESSDEDLICRREQVTGTHRRIRRCYTRAQLKSMREEAQRLVRDRIRQPAVIGAPEE